MKIFMDFLFSYLVHIKWLKVFLGLFFGVYEARRQVMHSLVTIPFRLWLSEKDMPGYLWTTDIQVHSHNYQRSLIEKKNCQSVRYCTSFIQPIIVLRRFQENFSFTTAARWKGNRLEHGLNPRPYISCWHLSSGVLSGRKPAV